MKLDNIDKVLLGIAIILLIATPLAPDELIPVVVLILKKVFAK
jgi:hypothetical protein